MVEKKSSGPPLPKKLGGAVFPRLNLEDAIEFSNKLVSKTHVAPQPSTTIFPGVFGVGPKNTVGQVRASALKQFKLLEGKPTAYSATDLAKKIATSVPEEIGPLLRQACLEPRIFRMLFDTFQNDSVSVAKLRQQASAAGVHPEQAENCARLFAERANFARIGNLSDDTLQLSKSIVPEAGIDVPQNVQSDDVSEDEQQDNLEKPIVEDQNADEPNERRSPPARSVIQVSVSLDSSLDTEKLEKQLQLLRKYGAI